jgi:hypothetical protein
VDGGAGTVELKRRDTPLRAGRSRWRGRRAEEDDPECRSTGGRRQPCLRLRCERDTGDIEKMRLAN